MHEMAHARIAACELEREEGAHQRPAQAAAIHNGGIDLLGRCYIFFDEPEGLAPERFHQPIGDEAFDFLTHM